MNYFEIRDAKAKLHINELLYSMPLVYREFFTAKELVLSAKTLENYVYPLRDFFNFLSDKIDVFQKKPITRFSLCDLEKVTKKHIEQFLLSEYGKCAISTVAEKFYKVEMFFKFFCAKEKLNKNPAEFVDGLYS